MMSWMSMNFQNPNSINMSKIVMLHNMIMIVMINIMTVLMTMIIFNMKNKFNNKSMNQNQKMETMWMIVPMATIMVMSMMSISTLFMNNEMKLNSLNIKITGNQWFWNYEYPNMKTSFNSYLVMKNNFDFFMIETDNSMIAPFNYQVMLIMSSTDVIHSWTIPSMNIKMDCIPNQINSMTMMMMKPTIVYGQCSEICGINHSFMPIKVESIPMKQFIKTMK